MGDTGPGGGKIFYVATTPFACGPTGSETCRYLEAAPITWSRGTSDPTLSWATGTTNQSTAVTGAAGTAIGTGYKNSLDIVAQTGNVAASSAAVAAREYGGGSKNDWFLPSKDELNQLYLARTTVGGFVADYWSSSEGDAIRAWSQSFTNGVQNVPSKTNPYYVRPVRALATVTLAALTCATGGTCSVGDTGPGGGTIFYVAGETFTQVGASGSMCTTNCKYLEAAPANWIAGGDPQRTWATNINSNQSTAVTGAAGTAIGTGYKNSLDIVAQTGNVAASSAAVAAREYGGGSKNDWYLPSKDELNQLYVARTTVGVFHSEYYWSSSESGSSSAWSQKLGDGFQSSTPSKSNLHSVRPVRAF